MLPKKWDDGTKRVASSIIIWFAFLVIEVILLSLLGNSVSMIFLPSLIAAIVPALSIYIISWSYSFLYKNFEEAFSSTKIEGDLEKELMAWWGNAANLGKQIWTSIIFTVLGAASITVMYLSGNFPTLKVFKPNSGFFEVLIFSIFIVFWGAQGIYWGWVLPSITQRLNQIPVTEKQIYSVDPSKSPLLFAISNSFSFFALEIAIMITLCIIGSFTLQPDVSEKFLFGLSILILGYIVSSWTFLYPQFYLSTIIKKAKRATIIEIQKEIEVLYKNIGEAKSADFERLKNLRELQSHILQTPDSLIYFRDWRNFIGSLLTPTIVAISGWVDWNSFAQKLLSLFR